MAFAPRRGSSRRPWHHEPVLALPVMIPRPLGPLLLLCVVLCGGCLGTSQNAGSGTGGTGGGDGDVGDGDLGDGDGDGDGAQSACGVDTDCVAVADTSAPCYSQGCSLPVAVSQAAAAADPCLVPWVIGDPPAVPDGCGPGPGAPVACTLGCAQPPTCIDLRCDAGTCVMSLSQDGSDCSSGGGGSGAECDALDAAREQALQAARECLPNGIIVECATPQSIPGACGCPVAVNDNHGELVQAAQAAYDTWNADCEPPTRCQLIDCAPATGQTGCQDDAQGRPVCAWQ